MKISKKALTIISFSFLLFFGDAIATPNDSTAVGSPEVQKIQKKKIKPGEGQHTGENVKRRKASDKRNERRKKRRRYTKNKWDWDRPPKDPHFLPKKQGGWVKLSNLSKDLKKLFKKIKPRGGGGGAFMLDTECMNLKTKIVFKKKKPKKISKKMKKLLRQSCFVF